MSVVRVLSPKATQVIRYTYAIGGEEPDPHNMLTNIARGVAVVGKLPQDLSDKYNIPGKRFASWLITAGRLFWGIIELSVPNSVFRYLFRNWLWLLALVSLIILSLGAFLGQSNMCGIGAALLGATLFCSLISHACYRFMFVGRFPLFLMRFSGVALVLLLSAWVPRQWGDRIAEALHWSAYRFQWAHEVKPTDLIHRAVAYLNSFLHRIASH
jgi:hypothetical protein